METDSSNGSTRVSNNPWIIEIRKRHKKQLKNTSPSSQEAVHQPTISTPRTATKEPPPRLPQNNYTIVYRPRDGLRVASLTTQELTAAFAVKCNLLLPDFFRKVTLLLQPVPNVLVASTADPDLAITLSEIDSLQLATRLLEFSAYMKPPPGSSRGVIHGLDPVITEDNLMEYLQGNAPTLLHARIMGKTRSALLTFRTKFVPYYVKVGSVLIRCRPFRRSVQVCRVCGELGHRSDVCPTPDHPKCLNCGLPNPPTSHSCDPKCQLCLLPHATAGKDCPRRFLPQLPARKPNMQAPNQVSWSAIVARAPAAHPPPPTTNPFPPLQPTPNPLPPIETVLPPPPPALIAMLSTLQDQNAQLLARVKALEAERATLPSHPPPPATPPAPSATITTEKIEEMVDARLHQIIDARLNKHILPQVQQMNEQVMSHFSKMLTDATETFLRTFNERIGHLERVMNLDNPPQTKKTRMQDGQ